MRRYKLTLTRRAIEKRLAAYPPRLLREAMLLLDHFEIKHDLQYHFTETLDERDAVQKELLAAYFQEQGATKSQIAGLLKRIGLR